MNLGADMMGDETDTRAIERLPSAQKNSPVPTPPTTVPGTASSA